MLPNKTNLHRQKYSGLSIRNVVIRIILVIALVEFFVMIFFSLVHWELGTIQEAMLDAVLLSSFSAPFIYYLIIRPFILARDVAEANVRHLALHDPLTDLPNRRLLSSHISYIMEQCIRNNVFGALILVDLDDFKPVNDELGHEAGDFVLKKVAEQLKSTLRQSDFTARLGGDEFVIGLDNIGDSLDMAITHSEIVAEKLHQKINRPFSYNDQWIKVDASIGIRVIEPKKNTVENLLHEADVAMYDSKKAGRACITTYKLSTVA